MLQNVHDMVIRDRSSHGDRVGYPAERGAELPGPVRPGPRAPPTSLTAQEQQTTGAMIHY